MRCFKPIPLPLVNTEVMNLHLAEIAHRYCNDPIVLALDGASWHESQGLKIPENISLIPLPTYSPELNPVEQLWKALRKNGFPNKRFLCMDSLENSLVEALRWSESTLNGFNHLRDILNTLRYFLM